MKKSILIFFALFLIILSFTLLRKTIGKHELTGLEVYQLTDSQLLMLKAEAKRGDPNAAYKVADYYQFVGSNIDESIYWLRISASKGHVAAQSELGRLLLDRAKTLQERAEAVALLKSAASAGDRPAAAQLKRMNEVK